MLANERLFLPILGALFLWWTRNSWLKQRQEEEKADYYPIQIDESNTLCHSENSLGDSLLPKVSSTHREAWCRGHPRKGSVSNYDRELLSPNVGSVRALVLLLQFPEHGNRTLPSREYFDELCNNNISAYFSRQSYGQYDVSCDVMPWVTLPYSQEFYANAFSNLVGREYASEFFLPVLDTVPDLSIYDADDDGAMDVVIALHSGYAAEYRRGQTCGAPETRHRFHSQGHPDSPEDTYVRNNTRLAGYAISSVFDWVCSDEPAGIGIIAHEWLHALRGLPDLYDPSTGRVGGIAAFGIMGAAKGPIFGKGPSSMTAFSRIRTGWMEATEIVYNGQYIVLSLNDHPQAYIIRQGFADKEYLLIENRPAVDDDDDLFGGGLLVFHVDDNKRVQGATDWPLLEDHYKVAVVQADGRYDIEQGNNNGDEDDFWKVGSVLESPATDSYFNGPTGISMRVITYNETDYSVVIEISGLMDGETTIPTNGGGTTTAPTATPSHVPTRSPMAPPSLVPSSSPVAFPFTLGDLPTLAEPTTPAPTVVVSSMTSDRPTAITASVFPTMMASPTSNQTSQPPSFVNWVEMTDPSDAPTLVPEEPIPITTSFTTRRRTQRIVCLWIILLGFF